jgi:hypothetical protein
MCYVPPGNLKYCPFYTQQSAVFLIVHFLEHFNPCLRVFDDLPVMFKCV